MTEKFRIQTLDWDNLVPIERGEVNTPGNTIELERYRSFASMTRENLSGAENSFARYTISVDQDPGSSVGIPAFIMTAFRHRCAIVREDSDLRSFADLRGKTVGLTGWPTSGDVWTRQLVRRAGVELSEINWVVAPMNPGEMNGGHHSPVATPDYVRVAEDGYTLEQGLLDGSLDCVFSPWWPETSLHEKQPIRHLVENYRELEIEYFKELGFIPGIHLIVLNKDVVDANPELPGELLQALEDSKWAWQDARFLKHDSTPWAIQDLEDTYKITGRDWMPYGVERNRPMIEMFVNEMFEQGLISKKLTVEELFPHFLGDNDLKSKYGEIHA